jgi:hypothetical protein
MNFIISLTSIPSKFKYINLTINSILNQTLKPLKIIINIPLQYSFRFNYKLTDDDIDFFKKEFNNNLIQLNFVNTDYGPGTKLLGLFENNILNQYDDIYIILIDDDHIYKNIMIELFFLNILSFNCSVASFYTYKTNNNITVAQGADGFLIKKDLLNDEFLNYYNKIKNFDYIGYHDDYYISYFIHLKNIQIHHILIDGLIYEQHENTFIDSLYKLEGEYNRGNVSNHCIQILEKIIL